MPIMNKEGDERVYFCFWYINSNMLALGLLKYSPVSSSRGRRKKQQKEYCSMLLSRTNIIVMSLDSSTYLV